MTANQKVREARILVRFSSENQMFDNSSTYQEMTTGLSHKVISAMNRKSSLRKHSDRCARRGAVVILVVLLLIPLLMMVAFAVDYGYLLKVRTDLQRAADTAALAAAQDLIPDADGNQDLDAVRARLREYVPENTEDSFEILDADITIGRYDPSTIYSNSISILNNGTFDTVRVTLRYDATANAPVSLFFAKVLGLDSSPVTATATAVLQKPSQIGPGADVLPFAVPYDDWEDLDPGDIWSIYGDGKVEDEYGSSVPGNWGTVDIGKSNNSTNDLKNQITDGLRQSDLDALYNDGRISTNEYIDAGDEIWLNADPGLSSGMKSAVQGIHGQTRLVPLYDANNGAGGNNLEYRVKGWGVVKVVDSNWNGNKNTYVKVQKASKYDSALRPNPDLSNTTGTVEAAYTSPVLVE